MPLVPQYPNNGGLMYRIPVDKQPVEKTPVQKDLKYFPNKKNKVVIDKVKLKKPKRAVQVINPKKKTPFNSQPIVRKPQGKCSWCGRLCPAGMTIHPDCAEIEERVKQDKRERGV